MDSQDGFALARSLPDGLGAWNSTCKRFARWQDAEVWRRVFAELWKDADFAGEFIDSTIVRTPTADTLAR